ncbi:MAG: AAA family ATPase [Candidatus Paceibacterota bacterium]
MTQSDALKILKTGANVFLTGAPGAGKTYVLNQYIDYLEDHDIAVAVTASTGIAATHIGGVTIHSWSGIGAKQNLTDWDIDEIESKKYLWNRFDKTKVLVIDEISMLSAGLLDSVNKVCKAFKRNELPFGGLQIVFVGDFFQLPPVVSRGEEVKFAFESVSWKELNPLILYITEQHRQDDDSLLSILGRIRSGDIEEEFEELRDRLEVEFEDVIKSTKLYTHNKDVDEINNKELEKIDGDEEYFEMISKGKANHVTRLKESCLSPENLCLKVGAVVMCTKNNFEAGYVNGTLGEVIDFNEEGHPIIITNKGKEITIEPTSWNIEDGDKVLASISQIPLRLAWAITVHKSQGMSLDAAEIDLGKAFEFGQGYVALSRVRSLDGLKLLGFNSQALMVHPKILDFDKKLRQKSDQIESYLNKKTEEELKKSQDDFIVRAEGSLQKIDKEAKKKEQEKTSTFEKTRALLLEGKNIDEVAVDRGLTKETVVSHIERLVMEGKIQKEEVLHLCPKSKKFKDILKTFQKEYDKTGELNLSPIKNKLKDASYFDIQLARVFLER